MSRDKFKQYHLPAKLEQRVIPFAIINDEVIFSPKLQKYLQVHQVLPCPSPNH